MIEPPRNLGKAEVVAYAVVTAEVMPTGATRHVVEASEVGAAAALAIARYPRAEGFYLYYLDGQGEIVTDTYHQSIEGAKGQAAFEYVGLAWTEVGRDEG